MKSSVVNQLKTVALLGAMTALLVVIGGALAPGYLWLFGAIAVVMNLVSYFFSDRIVLAMNRAHPIGPGDDPQLERMVAELAARANIPVPRIYVVEDDAPNAFATGRNPAHGVVAVTTGIRRLLSERELRGVIAHELAHIKNRDILVASIAAMIASVVSFVATAIQWGAIFGGSRDDRDASPGGAIGALALAIVAPIAATIIQLAISRSREYLADATGARLADDPLALASALAKLERGNARIPLHTVGDSPATASLFICAPLSGGSVASWFSTHPPMAERIRRLEELAGSYSPAPRPARRVSLSSRA
ncbi:MAG: zinc metalloprotease HtpX [Kofleriaceae bacterium]|nr:MAG: zinc metalloprotease HtpX [Kofleriaceae bacterium]MBZ0235733.1 zinc metalloprotease HtpX [Kofleriaceae bacterium]